jgi:predicted nucleotidyltransferase component of viral defense system
MIGEHHRLTEGYVGRHIPPASRLGRDVAILDIAQDFLLAHLQKLGLFDGILFFKGGTALRKFFAGGQGRFSTDLDFAIAEIGQERGTVMKMVAEAAEVTTGPFEFYPEISRGRWSIRVSSTFGDPVIRMKLDVGPPLWLEPELRPFVTTPIHSRYGFDLPSLPVMRLEEILAEKVARLTRTATARDASDLVWARTTNPYSRFSTELVRRLAVLKVWVDNHGLAGCWHPALSPRPFDPDVWLQPRRQWDDEQIGMLAHPPPSLLELERDLAIHYSWLQALTTDEARWARATPGLRGEVISAIRELEGGMLADAHLY